MIEIHNYSIRGNKEVNEDDVKIAIIDDDHSIVAVADGMGGLECGDVASKIVCNSLVGYIREHFSGQTVEQLMTDAFDFADQKLSREMDIMHTNMGTAALLAIITPRLLYFSWLGNVRLYHEHNGIISQLSSDHLVDTGYGDKRLTRCVKGKGLRKPLPYKECKIYPSDRLYICTDGFYMQYASLTGSQELSQETFESQAKPEDDATIVTINV